MRSKFLVVRKWFFIAGLCVFVSGCGHAKVNPMDTTDWKTHCFGRFLVDLPETFRVNYRVSSVTLYFGRDENFETVDVQISEEGISSDEYIAAVEKRSEQIAAETSDVTNGSMLLLKEEIESDEVLLRYQKSDISDRSQVHEVHLLISGVHVFLKANSYQGVIAPVEARLIKLAKRIHAVSDLKNAGPGFCLGPIVIDAENDYELADVHFRDGNRAHRDVSLDIEMNTFKQDGDASRLVDRIDSVMSTFGFGPKVFRKGQTQLAGMPAEEWLGRHREDGRTQHAFSIESYPLSPGIGSAVLQLRMKTGGRIPNLPTKGLPSYIPVTPDPASMSTEEVDTSLNDDEAVSLWDAIIESIRLRPGSASI
ncbi:T6SS immunity protein Tli4 family protein [Pseudoxanthomonas kalamensis]|uniref:T6SS immunity protein Tli4 family protein n=1 Tax=Pseudoxanthomonas kalamensis TaxID=289483 RepID=UPI001390B639|nr:T6SS immunity protein Tli4 family protein [Pseudoxanthomonas kalamensis]